MDHCTKLEGRTYYRVSVKSTVMAGGREEEGEGDRWDNGGTMETGEGARGKRERERGQRVTAIIMTNT